MRSKLIILAIVALLPILPINEKYSGQEIIPLKNSGKIYRIKPQDRKKEFYKALEYGLEDSWICDEEKCLDIGRGISSVIVETDIRLIEKTRKYFGENIEWIHLHPPHEKFESKEFLDPPGVGDVNFEGKIEYLYQRKINSYLVSKKGIWYFDGLGRELTEEEKDSLLEKCIKNEGFEKSDNPQTIINLFHKEGIVIRYEKRN